MHIVLISTCVVSPDRVAMLDRMLASTARAQTRLTGRHHLVLRLLLQQCETPPPDLPAFVQVETIPEMISISAARNRLLRPLFGQSAFDADTLVAFPDDDCWYPDGVLEAIVARFDADPALDFFLCRYGTAPLDSAHADFARVRPAAMKQVVRNASSNTIFLRGPLMVRAGQFDETLGVGTPNGGAEDLDIAIAAFLAARRSEYLDAAIIGHRDKNTQLRARYYKSGLLVLRRYAGQGTWREFLRKLLVGVAITLKGELSLKGLIEAYCTSGRTLKS